MADLDDEFLAFAMALDRDYKLYEPLPSKAKKAKYREFGFPLEVMKAGVI